MTEQTEPMTSTADPGPPELGSFRAGYHEGREDLLYAIAAGHQWALDLLAEHKAKQAKIGELNALIKQEQEGRAEGLPEGASSPRSTSDSPPFPTPVQGKEEAIEDVCDRFAAANAEQGRLAKADGYDTAWHYFGMAKEISLLKAELLYALKSSSLPRGK